MSDLKPILLVEDNANDVELTLAALAESHLANEVIVCRDGVEAVEYLSRSGKFAARQAGNPAVVLLDLKLPRMDGLEVLEHIKNHAEYRTIPVVMLTGSREDRDLIRSYKLGVNGYVVKPIVFEEFVSAVKELGLFWAVINTPPPGSVKARV